MYACLSQDLPYLKELPEFLMFKRFIKSCCKRYRKHRKAMQRASLNNLCQFQPLEPRVLLSASIEGRVWIDANMNGIQDPKINGYTYAEDGISGITVVLVNAETNLVVEEMTTIDKDFDEDDDIEQNGLYSFTGLAAGNYYLQFETSHTATDAVTDTDTDYQLTFQNAKYKANFNLLSDEEYLGVSLITMDSDANTITGKTAQFTLSDGQVLDDLDAGYIATFFELTSTATALTGTSYDLALDINLPDYLQGYPVTIEITSPTSTSNLIADEDITVTDQTGAVQTQGDLYVTLNYDFDQELTNESNEVTNAVFFDTQFKKDLMQYAASTIVNRFGDDLTGIDPSGSNTWSQLFYNYNTGLTEEIEDATVDANEFYVYATSFTNQNTSTLGTGGPGGYGVNGTETFVENMISRGETGIYDIDDENQTDVAPWGGSINFNNIPTKVDNEGTLIPIDWYFGLESPDPLTNKTDFLSVAMHEMMHLFGFGTATTWDNQRVLDITITDEDAQTGTVTGVFTGNATNTYLYGTNYVTNGTYVQLSANDYSQADADANPVLQAYPGHLADKKDTDPPIRETAMSPSLAASTRKLPTALDYYVLDDLGWDLLEESSVALNSTIAATNTFTETGAHTITVTLLTDLGSISFDMVVDVTDVMLTVNSVVANGADVNPTDPTEAGLSFSQFIQRSELQNIVITFNREVDGVGINDIELIHIDELGNATQAIDGNIPISTNDNVTFTIDLSGFDLEDGVYIFQVQDSVIDVLAGATLDGDDDGTAGGTFNSDRFHQLAGDFNGDAAFNLYDLNALAYYWEKVGANPPSYLDADNTDTNNIVNQTDINTLNLTDNWMARLDLDVVIAEAPEPLISSSASPSMSLALAAYSNNQASLMLTAIDDGDDDGDDYEDLIGQWLPPEV